jgi:hypothetical protein
MANGTSAIDALLQELSQYLHLTNKVILKQGGNINVGENFMVRFTLTNSAPPPTYMGQPRIRFKAPYLQLLKTEYARPVMPDGSAVDGWGHDFPDTMLDSGESTALEVPMLATADIVGWTDFFLRERIATAWVSAKLDTDEYFLLTNTYTIRTEIEP